MMSYPQIRKGRWKTMDTEQIIAIASDVFHTEIEGLETVRKNLNRDFVRLVEKCIEVIEQGGKIVVCGVGKSGHVGRKISATLASTGSPSIFMHPVEAMHGDLGMLQEKDLLLTLSYSGETDELLSVILPAKRLGAAVASFTGSAESSLAKMSDYPVIMEVPREACPFNLAPTTTSTATLVLGDALAMILLKLRRFTKENYGRLHPGGAIGRAVTMRVKDLMRKGDKIVVVPPGALVKDTLVKMTSARCGSAIIADEGNRLLGIFTDGDFRRFAEKDLSILTRKMEDVMTRNPASVSAESLAVEALKIVEKRKIDDIIVIDAEGKVAGLVDLQDLPGLKLM